MKTWKRVVLIVLYILASLGLLFYSFTQIDLGLTVSRIGIIQTAQRWFAHFGYFERPQSTFVYIGLLLLWFSLYALMLYLSHRKKISFHFIWTIIFVIVSISIFSYPAFSYDFFNYMFTAKTVALYHKNPYSVIPLDFTGFDPWIMFMRWTHLPSAYTPLWISLTIPLYLLSFGVFLPFLFLLKGIFSLSYVLSCIAIYLVSRKEKFLYPEKILVAFALNPLVIIESLISPHNDIVMMALVLWAYVFFIDKKHFVSVFFFALSIGLKFMTIFIFPMYFLRWNRKGLMMCMLFGFFLVLMQREVLPWYFLWLMPFAAFLSVYTEVLVILFGASLGLLLRYAPYLYLGNWDPPAMQWKSLLTLVPLICSIALAAGIFLKRIARKI
ncbi:MAG: hypothetical protein AAB508_04835 [Patescibacteria group bacterium]